MKNPLVLLLIGAMVLTLFGMALLAALGGTDASFKIAMGTGAYGLANQVIGYWFGSSAGSDKKTDIMKEQHDASVGH